MSRKDLCLVLILLVSILWTPACCYAQANSAEASSGSNRHEFAPANQAHALGDWGGERTRLEEHGVDFDIQYVADHLWNVRSSQPKRFASWNRFRGTIDLDLDSLARWQGTYVHATAVWQGGGNLGQYLGLVTSPSGMSSGNTFRLDSWWIEKRFRNDQVVFRTGQFAAQDFYGVQHYGASFIFEPMGYALGNLATTYESFDPPSTPALELRVAPLRHAYVKSMAFAADREPYAHNPTGLVPQFRGAVMNASEIGFSSGENARSIRGFDNIETRKGYVGLYKFGAAYNPGKFTQPQKTTPRTGDYLMYWMANQAIWRVDPSGSKGLDATLSYDWSPSDVNRNNSELTAGLRYNEPIPVKFHNTVSLGYVLNHLSADFHTVGTPDFKQEHGLELNSMLHVTPCMLVQPVVQYYLNIGGGSHRAAVLGLRTKIDF